MKEKILMKYSKYRDAQIMAILKQAENGVSFVDLLFIKIAQSFEANATGRLTTIIALIAVFLLAASRFVRRNLWRCAIAPHHPNLTRLARNL